MAHFKTKEALDKAMDIKWNALRASCPQYNIKWIGGMHELLDWYEHKLQALTQPNNPKPPKEICIECGSDDDVMQSQCVDCRVS
jgi:hypothetical protein